MIGKIWLLDNLALDLTNSTVKNNLSASNTNASAIVTDTAFPNVADVHVNTTTSSNVSSNSNHVSNVQQTQSSQNYVTPTSSDSESTPVTPEGGGGGSGNNTG